MNVRQRDDLLAGIGARTAELVAALRAAQADVQAGRPAAAALKYTAVQFAAAALRRTARRASK